MIILSEDAALKAEQDKLQDTREAVSIGSSMRSGRMFASDGTLPQEKALYQKVVELTRPVPALVDKVASSRCPTRMPKPRRCRSMSSARANAAVRDAIEELVNFENKLNEDAANDAERNYAVRAAR